MPKKQLLEIFTKWISFVSWEKRLSHIKHRCIFCKKKSETLERKILQNQKLEDAVYFDAGTGRGLGVEVRITDKNKKSLIESIGDEKFEKFLENKKWTINCL